MGGRSGCFGLWKHFWVGGEQEGEGGGKRRDWVLGALNAKHMMWASGSAVTFWKLLFRGRRAWHKPAEPLELSSLSNQPWKEGEGG